MSSEPFAGSAPAGWHGLGGKSTGRFTSRSSDTAAQRVTQTSGGGLCPRRWHADYTLFRGCYRGSAITAQWFRPQCR